MYSIYIGIMWISILPSYLASNPINLSDRRCWK